MLPALIAGAARFAPTALSILGGLLPSIAEAIAGGRSEEDAKALVEPHVQETIDRLVGGGMSRPKAEAEARRSLQGEVDKAMEGGGLNPMLMTALSVVGAVVGHKVGGKIAGHSAMGGSPSKVNDTAPDVVPAKPPGKSPAMRQQNTHGAETVDMDLINDRVPSDKQKGALGSVVDRARYDRNVAKEIPGIEEMEGAMASGKGQTVGPFPGPSQGQQRALGGVVEGQRFDRQMVQERPRSGHQQGLADTLKMLNDWEAEGVMPAEIPAPKSMTPPRQAASPFPLTPR